MATATTTKTKTKATKKTKAKRRLKRERHRRKFGYRGVSSQSETIEKYLGRNYKVVASVGHIRDLKNQVCLLILKTTTNHSISIFVVKDPYQRIKERS